MSKINLTYLKQQLGIVSQDAQLFSGTIRDNLLFVAPEAMEDQIWKVLTQASLDGLVKEFPT